MINFRFHIVSLTAVLLSLGIGLMLGTTFLDTATVDVLRDRQGRLEDEIDASQEHNAELNELLEARRAEHATFGEQIGERLFPGLLTDVPVLVVSTRGVDEEQVAEVEAVLTQADADVVGTWWLTDRLRLDDDDEVADLADALQLSTDDVDRLRSSVSGQVGDVLFAASDSSRPAGEAAGEEGDGGEGEASGDAGAPAGGAEAGGAEGAEAGGDAQGLAGAVPRAGQGAEEPAVMARLREAGFVEYEMPEGAEGDVITLPSAGLRLVVVTDPEASVPASEMLVPVLVEYSFSGPVPAVVAEPSLPIIEDEDAPPPESLVIAVREDDDLSSRVSTVDDVDRVAGVVALLLAVQDLDPASPHIGHYGNGDGTRLLPPPPEEGE